MRAIDVLKYLLEKAESETPEGHRIVGVNVPVDIVREIIDAQPEQRWILISERLPEEYEYVLLCDREPGPDEGTSYSRMAVGWLEDGQIHCWDDRAVREEFVAWMPLPEPYKEGEQE